MTDELDEIKEMAQYLRAYLDTYLDQPTATGYHFLRNKIAEYYSVSAARQEEEYAREQDRMREALGIRTAR